MQSRQSADRKPKYQRVDMWSFRGCFSTTRSCRWNLNLNIELLVVPSPLRSQPPLSYLTSVNTI